MERRTQNYPITDIGTGDNLSYIQVHTVIQQAQKSKLDIEHNIIDRHLDQVCTIT